MSFVSAIAESWTVIAKIIAVCGSKEKGTKEVRMPRLSDRLNDKKEKELRVLADFMSIFCRENHQDQTRSVFPVRDTRLRHISDDKDLMLCQDCQKLLNHSIAKLLLCPYDPKPRCKKCETHCYAPGYREKIREVMRFSGLYLVKHGRLDLMIHYYF